MGQDFQGEGNHLKIEAVDDVRIKITNIGDKIVQISYFGIEKEIKQGESIVVLKMILENLNAKVR